MLPTSDDVPKRNTFFYNHNHGNWSYGPQLIWSRHKPAVGVVNDEATKEKLVIVTGGSYDMSTPYVAGGGWIYFNSTEILIGGKWSLGEQTII